MTTITTIARITRDPIVLTKDGIKQAAKEFKNLLKEFAEAGYDEVPSFMWFTKDGAEREEISKQHIKNLKQDKKVYFAREFEGGPMHYYDEYELEEGEAGVPGPQGPMGPMGPKGDKGDPADSVEAVEAAKEQALKEIRDAVYHAKVVPC